MFVVVTFLAANWHPSRLSARHQDLGVSGVCETLRNTKLYHAGIKLKVNTFSELEAVI